MISLTLEFDSVDLLENYWLLNRLYCLTSFSLNPYYWWFWRL